MAQAQHVGKLVLTVPHAAESAFRRGTVLITGGTGGLGALLARHLVTEHGARQLLLCARSGGGSELCRELESLGASVRVAACDVADESALRGVLATIAPEHPLCAVIHAAGVVDDAVITAQDARHIERVFAPKLDGAVHLDALTRELDLQAFVLFSSAAGVLGGPGQANYAAANSFMDALAHERRARGLPGTSLAWGLWQEPSGITRRLSAADRARMARAGVLGLSTQQGLALFDAALARGDALAVLARFDLAALAADSAPLRPVLRGLIKPSARVTALAPARSESLQQRIAGLGSAEREPALREWVTSNVAAVLGASAAAIAADQPLRELGLDSLMAVELRNRLSLHCGVRLPPTLLFNHPTPRALTQLLLRELLPAHASDGAATLQRELQRLETLLAELTLPSESGAALVSRLEALTKRLRGAVATDVVLPPSAAADEALLFASADDDQLFQLIDDSIGRDSEGAR
jgi:polyketide synthase 12